MVLIDYSKTPFISQYSQNEYQKFRKLRYQSSDSENLQLAYH